MNYPADSTAKLCQGGKGRYVGREGGPVDNCSREKCEKNVFLWKYQFTANCELTLLFKTKYFQIK